MRRYDLGETVIIKYLKASGTVVAIIPEEYSIGGYYLVEVNKLLLWVSEDDLLVYDKYYFDNKED